MSLYSRGTFGKDSFQWTKCVVKYVLDVYATASLSMISFLVEVGQHSLLIIQMISYLPGIFLGIILLILISDLLKQNLL